MKIPFLKEVPEFRPRQNLFSDVGPIDNKRLLDAIDILDQKSSYSITISTAAWNLVLVLAVVLVLIQGPAILSLVQGWLGAPHAAAVVREPGRR